MIGRIRMKNPRWGKTMIGVYLSGTGNTKHCIEKLIYLLDETAQAVPIEGKETVRLLSQHEFIVLAYPVQKIHVAYRSFFSCHEPILSSLSDPSEAAQVLRLQILPSVCLPRSYCCSTLLAYVLSVNCPHSHHS